MAGLSILDRLRFRQKAVYKFPPFGGDVRPAVFGPGRIKWSLARLSFIRTMLGFTVLLLGLVNLLFLAQVIGLLDLELIVSDGTIFGCRLPTLLLESTR